jgi:hypothetical protein
MNGVRSRRLERARPALGGHQQPAALRRADRVSPEHGGQRVIGGPWLGETHVFAWGA